MKLFSLLLLSILTSFFIFADKMTSEPCFREIEELKKKSNIELTHAMNHLNVELETMSNNLMIITDEKEE